MAKILNLKTGAAQAATTFHAFTPAYTSLEQMGGELVSTLFWTVVLFSKGEFDEAEQTYRRYLPFLKSEYQRKC